jgi:bifunctional NMN adenylyltransferase/nudix hydrolase
MTFEYTNAVVIGRFQILHNGHKKLIDTAIEKAEHVHVCIGSWDPMRTQGNPFTGWERAAMIRALYPDPKSPMHFALADVPGDDKKWAAGIMTITEGPTLLLTSQKEDSKWLATLKELFPSWDILAVSTHTERHYPINATIAREHYFYSGGITDWLERHCPPEVVKYLRHFQKTAAFWDAHKAFIGETTNAIDTGT